MMQIKSGCCKTNTTRHHKMTCGDECHEKYVELLVEKDGTHQMITDIETGMTYNVPTRLVIEKGISQEELKNYPRCEKDAQEEEHLKR